MIQRIQSIYLLLALILMGLLGWLPLGEIAAGDIIYDFNIRGVFEVGKSQAIINGLPIMVLLAIIELLQVIIIFSYKKRVRQMRLATYNIILMIGILVVGWIFIRASLKSIGDGVYVFQLVMAFPIVAAILNYMAIRAIAKDEALVRSIDRIR